MNGTKTVRLPRDTTRQAESLVIGRASRMTHRITGIAIVLFVLVHLVAQSVLHVPAFSAWKTRATWLPTLVSQNWIHAVLLFAIVFHTLYGLKLILSDLGWTFDYRRSFLLIVGISILFGIRELARYAGI